MVELTVDWSPQLVVQHTKRQEGVAKHEKDVQSHQKVKAPAYRRLIEQSVEPLVASSMFDNNRGYLNKHNVSQSGRVLLLTKPTTYILFHLHDEHLHEEGVIVPRSVAMPQGQKEHRDRLAGHPGAQKPQAFVDIGHGKVVGRHVERFDQSTKGGRRLVAQQAHVVASIGLAGLRVSCHAP